MTYRGIEIRFVVEKNVCGWLAVINNAEWGNFIKLENQSFKDMKLRLLMNAQETIDAQLGKETK